MKKVSLFMIAAVVAASAVLVSCDKGEAEPPSIRLDAKVGGGDRIAVNNGTSLEGDEGLAVVLNFKFTMGSNRIASVKIESELGGIKFSVLDSVLNDGLFKPGSKEVDFTWRTNVASVKQTMSVVITDKKDVRSDPFSFSITPKAVTPPTPEESPYIKKGAVTLMGGQNNATDGSFYSVALGYVMTVGAANSQQAKVDFVYYYGTNNKATIAAPNEATLSQIAYGSTRVSNWTTKNATKYFKVQGATANDPDSWFADNLGKPATDGTSMVTDLKVNDVVMYQTAGGLKGAYVVTAQSGTQSGTITIQIYEENK